MSVREFEYSKISRSQKPCARAWIKKLKRDNSQICETDQIDNLDNRGRVKSLGNASLCKSIELGYVQLRYEIMTAIREPSRSDLDLTA